MSPSPVIIISPIKDIPDWVIDTLTENMPDIFGFETVVDPLLADISFAYDEDRKQYYSTKILERLEKKAPPDGIKVLGVTREDLFIPILTHVYGEAQLNGKASIISTARLIMYQNDDGTSMENGRSRLIKEAAHELGHAFDLRHCDDARCIMHYCRRLEEVDQKTTRFCRYCKVLLSDAVNRYHE